MKYLILFFLIEIGGIAKQDLISGKFLTNLCPQNGKEQSHSDTKWKSAGLWLPLENAEEKQWPNNAKAAFGRTLTFIYITKAQDLILIQQTTFYPKESQKRKAFEKNPMSRHFLETLQRLNAFKPLKSQLVPRFHLLGYII